MRYEFRDYAWGVLELIPGVTACEARQRQVEQRLGRVIREVRWARAAIALPVLGFMLAGQQLSAQMAVLDAPAAAQRTAIAAKKTVEDKIAAFLKEYNDVGRFVSDAFISYKSFKMLNSIAERVRYGNIDFLVEMALPKIDFEIPEMDSKGNATGEYRRTTINFVSSPQQSQDNLNWLMRYGNTKIQRQLQQQPNNLRNISTKLLAKIKDSLMNPEGDVMFYEYGGDWDAGSGDYQKVNMRSPEVWTKLAIADATAAWVFSQHRVGLGTNFHDGGDAVQYIQQRERMSRNAELEAAYNRLIELQQMAAASGENLYNNPNYAAALQRYYDLAAADNRRKVAGTTTPSTASQRLQIIEEDAKAIQEAIGGYDVMLNSVQERTRATGENLNNIGKLYKGSQIPGNLNVMDFVTKDQPADQKAMMGVALKQLVMLQAVNQNMSELLKVMAAKELKDAKQDLEGVGQKKGALMAAVDNGSVAEMSAKAQTEQKTREVSAINRELTDIQSAVIATPVPDPGGKPGPNGEPPTLGVISVPAGGDPTEAAQKARKIFDDRVTVVTKKTVQDFQKELQADLTGMKGSKGFLMQTLMTFVGAVKQILGVNFNLAEESQAWEQAGQDLSVVYEQTYDFGSIGSETLTQIDITPRNFTSADLTPGVTTTPSVSGGTTGTAQ